MVKQRYICPNCSVFIYYDPDSDEMDNLICPNCEQVNVLDYRGNGWSAHQWYARKKTEID